MLLILTEKTDLTTDYLILKLIERNIPFVRLNTEDYNSSFSISLDYRTNRFYLHYRCETVPISEFSGVYFRRPALPNLEGLLSHKDIPFAEREIEALFSGTFRLLGTARWLNHPKNIFCANSKIEQLKIAKDLGFTIPPTLISSDKLEILNFIKSEKNVIAKAVKHGFYEYEDKVYIAFTKAIDANFIDNIDQYKNVPMILQKNISKRYDIRINIIGEKVFSTAILSQEWDLSKTDWRVWDVCEKFDLKHEKITLPIEIEEKCIAINRYFNLNFSAIDMVLDTEGNYIFLELNPNGQWAWIEEKVGYPIRDTIIDFLRGC